MESTIRPFVRKSVEVNLTLLDVLNDKLGLPTGTLRAKHPINQLSGSEARSIKSPPTEDTVNDKLSIGGHTDFGSLVSIFLLLPLLVLTYVYRHNSPSSIIDWVACRYYLLALIPGST